MAEIQSVRMHLKTVRSYVSVAYICQVREPYLATVVRGAGFFFRPMKLLEHVKIFSPCIAEKTRCPYDPWRRGAIVSFWSPCGAVCACKVDIRRR